MAAIVACLVSIAIAMSVLVDLLVTGYRRLVLGLLFIPKKPENISSSCLGINPLQSDAAAFATRAPGATNAG